MTVVERDTMLRFLKEKADNAPKEEQKQWNQIFMFIALHRVDDV